MGRRTDFMARVLGPHSERAHAVLRVVVGLLLSFHGMQKVLGVLAKNQPEVLSQIWIGGVIELVAGLLVAIGLYTRGAAFVASGTMAVAYIQFHWKFRFDDSFFPAVNRGELALIYSFSFLYFACAGAGPWSLDSRRGRQA